MSVSRNDFEFLSEIIKDFSGIILSEDKEYLVESRLTPIATKYGLSDINQLVQYARKNKDEAFIIDIIEAMTTNESFFFRDIKPFECLKDIIIPRIVGKCPDKRHIKIWSAACSTGQEPYSIAMSILEDPLFAGITFEIIATDLDSNVLDRAKDALYSQFEVQRGMPISLLIKYFTQEGEHWRVKSELRDKIKFKKFNLLDNPDSLGKFDIIFCRNVLIYFDKETKNQVLLNLTKQMDSHSCLVLGATENLIGLDGLTIQPLKNESQTIASGVFGFLD